MNSEEISAMVREELALLTKRHGQKAFTELVKQLRSHATSRKMLEAKALAKSRGLRVEDIEWVDDLESGSLPVPDAVVEGKP